MRQPSRGKPALHTGVVERLGDVAESVHAALLLDDFAVQNYDMLSNCNMNYIYRTRQRTLSQTSSFRSSSSYS